VIPTFCIAHKPPLLPASLYDVIVHTPPREDYPALASVVAHPVLARLIPDGPVRICGYRKILTRGETSHRTVTVSAAAQIPRVETEPHPWFEFLLCAHDFFKIGREHHNIREQWAASHHEADLRDCLALAVEMGVMSAAEAQALEAEPALIEGGCSMGVYPGALVREIVTRVWPLYAEFVRRHRARFMNYDPVQRRCVAFLAERIETHFLLKELRRRYPSAIPSQVFGCLTAVSDGPWVAGTMP
jgi:hypothetical protein